MIHAIIECLLRGDERYRAAARAPLRDAAWRLRLPALGQQAPRPYSAGILPASAPRIILKPALRRCPQGKHWPAANPLAASQKSEISDGAGLTGQTPATIPRQPAQPAPTPAQRSGTRQSESPHATVARGIPHLPPHRTRAGSDCGTPTARPPARPSLPARERRRAPASRAEWLCLNSSCAAVRPRADTGSRRTRQNAYTAAQPAPPRHQQSLPLRPSRSRASPQLAHTRLLAGQRERHKHSLSLHARQKRPAINRLFDLHKLRWRAAKLRRKMFRVGARLPGVAQRGGDRSLSLGWLQPSRTASSMNRL